MVHGESVIFKEAPGQGHLVGGLNESCTEVPPALLFTLVENVEW
jgi:hypothetical protein